MITFVAVRFCWTWWTHIDCKFKVWWERSLFAQHLSCLVIKVKRGYNIFILFRLFEFIHLKTRLKSNLSTIQQCNRDITDKATEFVLLLYHSVYGVFSSALKTYLLVASHINNKNLVSELTSPLRKATECLLNFSGNYRCTDLTEIPSKSWSGTTKCQGKNSVALSDMSLININQQ